MFKRKQKNVRIKPNQVFLHETDRFEPGQVYRVNIALARYFERNGWLEGSDLRPPASGSLEVDNSTLGVRGGM